MDGDVVQWMCKKQTGVSLSTMDVEFTPASHVARELLGRRELLSENGFQVEEPMKALMENQATIKQLESEISRSSAKHVDVHMEFVCDYAKKAIVELECAESRFMKTDILTKVLPAPKMEELRKVFGMQQCRDELAKGRV
uniref:AlNc14C288G10202 protein n=1 Tax=Albugo laibachii Nc14 TaxID=890382 RepID=F0WV57_9STRA|nr:AlNc14C288G10202 [Albugo laibachii Nc14]|eukprot:CCA25296.1 AlNc14C288G10202 [Albugo laibachii Nc14]